MPTPAFGTTIKYTDVTTEFTLSVNPPPVAIGANFRFASGTYTPPTPVIPLTGTISLSGNLGGKTKVAAPPGLVGNPTWIATMNFGNGGNGLYCATNANEDIYVGGQMTSTTATAYNAGTTTATSAVYTSGTLSSVALAKYNSAGIVQWVTVIDGRGAETFGRSAASTNNVYVVLQTGTVWPNAYSINGTSFVTMNTATTAGTIGLALVQYSKLGVANFMIGVANQNGIGMRPGAVAIDNDENIYTITRTPGVSGQLQWAYGANFSNVSGTQINYPVPANMGLNACSLIKWNAAGVPQFLAWQSGGYNGYGTAVAYNKVSQNIVLSSGIGFSYTPFAYDANQQVTGKACAVTIPSTSWVKTLIAYNKTGTAQFCTMVCNVIQNDNFSGLAFDSSGNIYIANTSNTSPTAFTAGLTTGITSTSKPTGGTYGAWIAKYSSTGVAQWITMVFGTGNCYGLEVSVDSYDNIYLTVDTAANAAISAYNAGSSAPAITSLVPVGTGTVWVKYDTSGVAISTSISYNSTTFTNWLVNLAPVNNNAYSTATAGGGTWQVYGTNNVTNISSANAQVGALIKYV